MWRREDNCIWFKYQNDSKQKKGKNDCQREEGKLLLRKESIVID